MANVATDTPDGTDPDAEADTTPDHQGDGKCCIIILNGNKMFTTGHLYNPVVFAHYFFLTHQYSSHAHIVNYFVYFFYNHSFLYKWNSVYRLDGAR